MYLQFEALEALRPHDIPRPIARVSVSNSNTTILLDEVFVECPQHSTNTSSRRIVVLLFETETRAMGRGISCGRRASNASNCKYIVLSLIHISEPTRLGMISYAV